MSQGKFHLDIGNNLVDKHHRKRYYSLFFGNLEMSRWLYNHHSMIKTLHQSHKEIDRQESSL